MAPRTAAPSSCASPSPSSHGANETVIKGPAETLTELSSGFWFDVGRGSAAAYDDRKSWLFRRVEALEFTGQRSVSRRISVDFQISEDLPDLGSNVAPGTHLVPISVFQKWPPLIDFDFVGPKGHTISLYKRTTNKKLDFGLLLGMVDRTLALGDVAQSWCGRHTPARRTHPPLSEAIRTELAVVVASPRPKQSAVESATRRLQDELERRLRAVRASAPDGDEIASAIARTVDLVAQLANNSILWAPVKGSPGTDRIVRFSYMGEYAASRPDQPGETTDDQEDGESWWRRVPETAWKRFLVACSWRQRTLLIPLPHAGRFTRYHLDIHAPGGNVQIVEAKVMVFPPASRDAAIRSLRELARSYHAIDVPDELIGPVGARFLFDTGPPDVLADTAADPAPARESEEAAAHVLDRRAHIYLGARSAPSHRVLLQVKLAATRQGFIFGCMLAALFIMALMWVVHDYLADAAIHLEPTVVLLAAVPVVLGYVLVRPGQHALERYHLAGVRVMMLIAGAMPIVGALALVLTREPHATASPAPPDVDVARPIWLGLSVTATLAFLGLAVSWLRSAGSVEGKHPPRT